MSAFVSKRRQRPSKSWMMLKASPGEPVESWQPISELGAFCRTEPHSCWERRLLAHFWVGRPHPCTSCVPLAGKIKTYKMKFGNSLSTFKPKFIKLTLHNNKHWIQSSIRIGSYVTLKFFFFFFWGGGGELSCLPIMNFPSELGIILLYFM